MLKAINISAAEAATIEKLPNNTVVISINSTNGECYPLKIDRNSSKVLTLRFDDVTAVKKRIYGEGEHTPITSDQAAELCNFIERNKESNFIIHCQAGISRSGAVALFIHRYYGHELKENFWKVSRPNYYVLGRLIAYSEYKEYIDDVHSVWAKLSKEDKEILKVR